MKTSLSTLFITLFLPLSLFAQSDSPQIEALSKEVQRLKESLVIPEDDTKKSHFGLGPAASKVYGAKKGVSIGGYGEFYMGHYLGNKDERSAHRGDMYRWIQYLGYKFSDNLILNSEIEIEHADEVFVEFSYLDWLISDKANIRAGLMLIPIGIVNEMHEPTTYHGNMRPETERTIIPSTWREMGVGLHGALGAGIDYKLYLVGGLNGADFDSKGVRGGRQKGSKFSFEDKGVAGRLDWSPSNAIQLGASAYYGGADQDPTGTVNINNFVAEAHGIFKFQHTELRALYAQSQINGANKVSALAGEEVSVPKTQNGYYVTAAYNLMPVLGSEKFNALTPFVRFEQLNLQAAMAGDAESDASLESTEITAGLEFKPHADVVYKLEYSTKSNAVKDSNATQEIRFGAGFIY